MYPTVFSTSYEVSSDFSLDPQESTEECTFCSGVNIIRCMTISVMNKHNEQPSFYLKLTQKLIENFKSPLTIKFQEILKDCDDTERLTRLYQKKVQKVETKEMLEYYKFRKFVPLFADLRLGKILHGYYYQRLKLYYNEVKRNLNLTVDPSSSSSFSCTEEVSNSQTFPKSKILEELTVNFKVQQTTGPNSIQNFKTESKALEDLVNYLKTNEKFNEIRPLSVQSKWKKIKKTSKEIFRDIIIQEEKTKDFNKNKSKIFITFYSKDGSIKKENPKKAQLKILKSQKLVKSKDFKTLNNEKEIRILQKLQRMKDEILDQKVIKMTKNDRQDKPNRRTKQQNIESGKKTPMKILEAPKLSERRRSFQRLTLDLRSQNLAHEQIAARSTLKPKKAHSESKLKQPSSLPKNKSTKALSNKQLHKFTRNQCLNLQENQTKELIVSNLTKKRPISRRKSLDLTKIKSLVPQTFEDRIGLTSKKEEYLTQRYDQNKIHQTPQKLMIRTSNVSPVARKQHNEETNQIILEKSDNIISIKKKKLQMLKKKIELQKTERK